jgi:hypothetical protein
MLKIAAGRCGRNQTTIGKGGKDVELVLVKIDQKANEVSDSDEASNILVCGHFLHVKTTRLN